MQYLTVLSRIYCSWIGSSHIITVMVDCTTFHHNIKYQPKTKCKYFICSFSISKGVRTVSGQILIAFPASFYLLLMVYNHAILLVHMLALFPSLHVSLSHPPLQCITPFLCCRNKFCPMQRLPNNTDGFTYSIWLQKIIWTKSLKLVKMFLFDSLI